MVPFSDFTAITLNLVEVLTDPFLLCFKKREPHIFVVNELASVVEFLVNLICHWADGAKICAIFSLKNEINVKLMEFPTPD